MLSPIKNYNIVDYSSKIKQKQNPKNRTNYQVGNFFDFYNNYKINFLSNSQIKRTSEPNLKTYTAAMQKKMGNDKVISYFLDGIMNIDTDTTRKKEPISILDVGCCDGALTRKLSKFLPENTKFYGLDLSSDMIEIARQKDKQEGIKNSEYIVGNAFNLPDKNKPKDAIIASSIMHEIYSYADDEYNEEAYSKESILHFMQQAYNSLKPGGVLMIKDPATPQIDEWELVKIANANKLDGRIPSIKDDKELKNADITQLCTFDKLRRFCMDFYPAGGLTKFDENDNCIMPRWLVCEFVRHRKWLATPENWAYEIKENYGTLRPDEISEFAKKVGFGIVKVENISIPNETNLYAIQENEFELKDLDDNELSLEDFPMFVEVVLRKPRDIKFNKQYTL